MYEQTDHPKGLRTIIKDVASNSAEFLLNSILTILILTEYAVSYNNMPPWFVEEKLNKRRHPYTFDNHLQQMCMCVKQFGLFNARCIPCGSSGLYRTELYNENGAKIHLLASIGEESKYLQTYLESNKSRPFNYLCFKYQLGKNKKTIKKLELVVPIKNQKNISYDITDLLKGVRVTVLPKSNSDIQTRLNEIKYTYTKEVRYEAIN